jgi:hypothetical protein
MVLKKEYTGAGIARTRFMFDTNIFDKILKIPNLLTDKHEYFITHIQNDELDAAPPEIKKKWLNVFQIIPHQLIPTETAIIDVSRIGMAKIGHGELYNLILSELARKNHVHLKTTGKMP